MRSKTVLFEEAVEILRGLLATASVFYAKGITDANRVCDPLIVEQICDREDNHSMLMLIINGSAMNLNGRQFNNIILSEASMNKQYHFRNFLIHKASQRMRSAVRYLFDDLYRIGARKTTAYDGKRLNNILNPTKMTGTQYLTPLGVKSESSWFDLLRQYITEIEVIQLSAVGRSPMSELDEYMSQIMSNKLNIESTVEIEDERRKFILSGGDL